VEEFKSLSKEEREHLLDGAFSEFQAYHESLRNQPGTEGREDAWDESGGLEDDHDDDDDYEGLSPLYSEEEAVARVESARSPAVRAPTGTRERLLKRIIEDKDYLAGKVSKGGPKG